MTKYKEYLRAKGIKLECDFEVLPYNGIAGIATYVVDDGVVAEYYHESTGSRYHVYDKYGVYSYFFDSWEFHAYIVDTHCDPEYIDFLRDMGYDNSEWALTVMRNTYEDHAKIRVAFKHTKAGIMDARTFYKLALRYRFY